MLPLISVVVCTYNRAGILRLALEHLCRQTLDAAEYEVLVVDNNSRDHTAEVCTEFQARFPNVRYCREERQGLSHARNRGLHEACGEYVGYTDDDCRVPPQWLEVASQIIRDLSPGVFGGPYYPCYDAAPPSWWRDVYGAREHAEKARFLKANEDLSGGNIFFRRQVLEMIGGFDPGLGMSGEKIGYGEESAALVNIRTQMPQEVVYYDPRMYVYHLVRRHKLSLKWIAYSSFVKGRLGARLACGGAKPRVSYWWLARAVIWRTKQIGAAVLVHQWRRDRIKFPHAQNFLYEQGLPDHCYALGFLFEQCLLWRR